MKTITFTKTMERFAVLILTFFLSVITFAQETTKPSVDITTTTTTTTEEWFTNPLYWVIGGLIFIILIAVIARGGGKRD